MIRPLQLRACVRKFSLWHLEDASHQSPPHMPTSNSRQSHARACVCTCARACAHRAVCNQGAAASSHKTECVSRGVAVDFQSAAVQPRPRLSVRGDAVRQVRRSSLQFVSVRPPLTSPCRSAVSRRMSQASSAPSCFTAGEFNQCPPTAVAAALPSSQTVKPVGATSA